MTLSVRSFMIAWGWKLLNRCISSSTMTKMATSISPNQMMWELIPLRLLSFSVLGSKSILRLILHFKRTKAARVTCWNVLCSWHSSDANRPSHITIFDPIQLSMSVNYLNISIEAKFLRNRFFLLGKSWLLWISPGRRFSVGFIFSVNVEKSANSVPFGLYPHQILRSTQVLTYFLRHT